MVPTELNQIRSRAGMRPLTGSKALQQAAHNHATYLTLHTSSPGWRLRDAHRERRGKKAYSGETPSQRAQFAGYHYARVLENVSIGNSDLADSLDGLMSGLYHRLAFLDFSIDEAGFARVDDTFVYKLGRHDLNTMCQSPPEDALFQRPENCLGTRVTRQYWDTLCDAIPQQAEYQPPFAVRCPNDQLLQRDFMQSVCENPPPQSLLTGSGSYYTLCKPPRKINVHWLKQVCDSEDERIRYPGTGAYYEICDDGIKVHANWLESACSTLPAWAIYNDSGYYQKPCRDNHKIRKEFLDAADRLRFAENPRYVVWPPADARDAPVAFYDETPNPVPDIDVSGYPLSLQFNPGQIKEVEINTIALYRLDTDGKISKRIKVRQLDAGSDPHEKLTRLQFAWFPLQALDWGTRYEMTVNMKVDGEAETLRWQFHTEALPLPAILLEPGQSSAHIEADTWTTLYLPPSKRLSRPFTKISARWFKPAEVRFETLTPNLIRVLIRNNFCIPVSLSLSNGETLSLKTCKGF